MSKIKVTLPPGETVANGKQITFTAPCACDVTESIIIDGVEYLVVDAMGQCVTGVGGVWNSGAQVSVIIDTEANKAYIQNQARQKFVIGDTEPQSGPAFWFCTSGDSDLHVANLEFGVPDGTSQIQAVVSGNTYDVENGTLNGEASSDSYNFEIL